MGVRKKEFAVEKENATEKRKEKQPSVTTKWQSRRTHFDLQHLCTSALKMKLKDSQRQNETHTHTHG